MDGVHLLGTVYWWWRFGGVLFILAFTSRRRKAKSTPSRSLSSTVTPETVSYSRNKLS